MAHSGGQDSCRLFPLILVRIVSLFRQHWWWTKWWLIVQLILTSFVLATLQKMRTQWVVVVHYHYLIKTNIKQNESIRTALTLKLLWSCKMISSSVTLNDRKGRRHCIDKVLPQCSRKLWFNFSHRIWWWFWWVLITYLFFVLIVNLLKLTTNAKESWWLSSLDSFALRSWILRQHDKAKTQAWVRLYLHICLSKLMSCLVRPSHLPSVISMEEEMNETFL